MTTVDSGDGAGLTFAAGDLPDGLRLAVRGEIDFSSAHALRARAAGPAADPALRRLVLDLTDVTFCDSSGLGALIALHKSREVAGGRFELYHVPGPLRHLLRITNLDEVFILVDEVV